MSKKRRAAMVEMTSSAPVNPIKQAVIDAADKHMPGRRIGSTPPKNWRDEAEAAIRRVGVPPDDGTIHSLGLTNVRLFCTAHKLPEDEGFVREFRRQAILARLRGTC